MDAKLVVVGGEARVTEVQLSLPTIVGRGRSAGLTLPHPLVSRQHCEIYESDGKLVVNDLGSLNGTFIGDKRLTEPTFLMPGELLTIGTVTFRAVYEAPGETDAVAGAGDDTTSPHATESIDKTVRVDETVGMSASTELIDDEIEELAEFDEVEDVEAVEEVDEIADVAEAVDEAEFDVDVEFAEMDAVEVDTADEAPTDDPIPGLSGMETVPAPAASPAPSENPPDDADDIADIAMEAIEELDDEAEVVETAEPESSDADDSGLGAFLRGLE